MNFLYQNPVPYTISECGFLILVNGFIAKEAPVKSTFTRIAPPSKAHPVAVDWGTALRDIAKGVIAEHTYSINVERLPYDSCLHRLES